VAKFELRSNYLPGCLPPCADWKVSLSERLRRLALACGPKRAISVGVGRQYATEPIRLRSLPWIERRMRPAVAL